MDPELGRFISLDPRLGSLSVPQSMNRYVYCVNNPLRFTDPTGEWFGISLKTTLQVIIIVVAVAATVATAGIASPLAAMAVGAAIGAISSAAWTAAAGGSLSDIATSALIGGVAGAIGGGIGAKFAQGGIGAGLGSKIASKLGSLGSKLTGKLGSGGMVLTKGEQAFGAFMGRLEADVSLESLWTPYSGKAMQAFGQWMGRAEASIAPGGESLSRLSGALSNPAVRWTAEQIGHAGEAAAFHYVAERYCESRIDMHTFEGGIPSY